MHVTSSTIELIAFTSVLGMEQATTSSSPTSHMYSRAPLQRFRSSSRADRCMMIREMPLLQLLVGPVLWCLSKFRCADANIMECTIATGESQFGANEDENRRRRQCDHMTIEYILRLRYP